MSISGNLYNKVSAVFATKYLYPQIKKEKYVSLPRGPMEIIVGKNEYETATIDLSNSPVNEIRLSQIGEVGSTINIYYEGAKGKGKAIYLPCNGIITYSPAKTLQRIAGDFDENERVLNFICGEVSNLVNAKKEEFLSNEKRFSDLISKSYNILQALGTKTLCWESDSVDCWSYVKTTYSGYDLYIESYANGTFGVYYKSSKVIVNSDSRVQKAQVGRWAEVIDAVYENLDKLVAKKKQEEAPYYALKDTFTQLDIKNCSIAQARYRGIEERMRNIGLTFNRSTYKYTSRLNGEYSEAFFPEYKIYRGEDMLMDAIVYGKRFSSDLGNVHLHIENTYDQFFNYDLKTFENGNWVYDFKNCVSEELKCHADEDWLHSIITRTSGETDQNNTLTPEELRKWASEEVTGMPRSNKITDEDIDESLSKIRSLK